MFASREGRARRLVVPVAGGVLALLGAVALQLRDPRVAGSWGRCPFQWLTGWDCPLCGGLRSVYWMTRADIADAVSSNLLVVVGLPFAVAWWVSRVVARWRGGEALRPRTVARTIWLAGLGVVVVFTLARNVPGSWLAA